MATTETLRPTANTIDSPTVTNPTNGYDGDTGTFALISEVVESASAAYTLDGFPTGSIPVNKRASAIMQVHITWGTSDPNDKAAVFMRGKAADPWTIVVSAQPTATFNGTYLSFDVTDVVGTEPASSWDVQVLYYNGGTGEPGGPPDPI